VGSGGGGGGGGGGGEEGGGGGGGGWGLENCIVMGFLILDYLQPNISEYTILHPRRQ